MTDKTIGRVNRATSPDLELTLGVPVRVLDHGFVRVVDYMGTDDSIVQAARVSYGEGTKTPSDDRSLIRYLMRHHHTTPFEMCEIKLHLKMPIFVARQWVRHRTASINEYSGRYSVMPAEFYVPEIDDIQSQSATNKQGRGAPIDPEAQHIAQGSIHTMAKAAFGTYEFLAGDGKNKMGVSRELARVILPLSAYTEFYWKIDLHNLLHFLRLRMDSHAQMEIRVYAEVVASFVREWCPVAYEAFDHYRLNGETFSQGEMDVLRALVQAREIEEGLKVLDVGLSAREQQEFLAKF
jgi:thymidylate synthase (FAD)